MVNASMNDPPGEIFAQCATGGGSTAGASRTAQIAQAMSQEMKPLRTKRRNSRDILRQSGNPEASGRGLAMPNHPT